MTDAERIAAGLTEAQRAMVVALCGNAWEGFRTTPGIRAMIDLGFMTFIPIASPPTGACCRFKSAPTATGLAVRAILMKGEG